MRLALLVLFLATPALADPVPAAGRIENLTGFDTCSAVLVDPLHVLTAGHCAGGAASNLGFRPGIGSDGPVFVLSDTAAHPFYDPEQTRPNWRVRFDIRIARLDEPVPDWVAVALPVGRPAEQGERLFILSWRRPDGSIPRQRACPVLEGPPGIVTLGCPVAGGESGAPVLRKTDDGLELVAIVSSRSVMGGHPVALATDVELRLPPLRDAID